MICFVEFSWAYCDDVFPRSSNICVYFSYCSNPWVLRVLVFVVKRCWWVNIYVCVLVIFLSSVLYPQALKEKKSDT